MTELPKSFEKELPNLASQELLVRWKQGDAQAANLLVERYSARLVALVASRLNHRYRRAISPEDLVHSAMGSFFGMVSDCRMQASRIHSVWSLLATIAKRKMLRAIERENTVKEYASRGHPACSCGGSLDLVNFKHNGQQPVHFDFIWIPGGTYG